MSRPKILLKSRWSPPDQSHHERPAAYLAWQVSSVLLQDPVLGRASIFSLPVAFVTPSRPTEAGQQGINQLVSSRLISLDPAAKVGHFGLSFKVSLA